MVAPFISGVLIRGCAQSHEFIRCTVSAVLSNMSVLRFFAFLVACSSVSALYFHIGETEKKCFIEEIPDETMVVGRFYNVMQSERFF